MVKDTIEHVNQLKHSLCVETARYFDAKTQLEAAEKQIEALRNAIVGIEHILKVQAENTVLPTP